MRYLTIVLLLCVVFVVHAQDSQLFVGEWQLIKVDYYTMGSPYAPYFKLVFSADGKVEVQQRFNEYQIKQLKEEEKWGVFKYSFQHQNHIKIGSQLFYYEPMNQDKILMLQAGPSDGSGWHFTTTCLLVRGKEYDNRKLNWERTFLGFPF
jgi:hypothetical protein